MSQHFGYLSEIVHETSGEVVSSNFTTETCEIGEFPYHMLGFFRRVRGLELATPQPAPVAGERVENFGIEPDNLALLLQHSLKPEEINGDERTQQRRVRELLSWFVRHTQGNANSKWLAAHAYELAWHVASNSVNRHIDAQKLREAGYVEGFHVSAKDRASLMRINPDKFKPVAREAAQPLTDLEPDLFWDDADPEMGGDIEDILAEYRPGDVVTLQCAKRLPNMTVRVLPANEDGEHGDYEITQSPAKEKT